MLFDIDWQGAQQLAAKARDDLVRVFILPPSFAELAQRLKTRASGRRRPWRTASLKPLTRSATQASTTT